MVDFTKHLGNAPKKPSTDPLKIHQQLDAEVSHAHLRSVQVETLRAFNDARERRDHIVRLSTGTGKTTVGLLMLLSYMREQSRPGVYLTPTKQLAAQVVDEARKLGADAWLYDGRHPPSEALNGRGVLVATYEKLFNSRTTFDRPDVDLEPVAMVLDDAHVGVERIRDNFTLSFDRDSEGGRFLGSLFLDSVRRQLPGLAEDIKRGDRNAIAEVPYWTWQENLNQVTEKLGAISESQELLFKWGLIRDDLAHMRCFISGTGVEVSPDILPVRRSRTFTSVEHRIFMSATLADDSLLVRELGCESEAASNPLVGTSDRGLGERMVILPVLFGNPSRTELLKWLAWLSQSYNVVGITPSQKRAEQWKELGASVAVGDVDDTIQGLRNGTTSFVAIVNRYDGIDLPDSACRVIVLDGLPNAETLRDAYQRRVASGTKTTELHNAFRLEQGMGRAVRSSSDYAVVVMIGHDVQTFVGKSRSLQLMGADTRAQIGLATMLAEIGKNTGKSPLTIIDELTQQCLRRDDGWKEFYREQVSDQVPAPRGPDEELIGLASAERDAFRVLLDGSAVDAGRRLREALNAFDLDPATEGILLQRAASYLYAVDASEAMAVQKAARQRNHLLLRPPEGVSYRRGSDEVTPAQRAKRWFQQFEHGNAAIADLERIRSGLVFDPEYSHSAFETALADLGEVLGATARRPEQEVGQGPDVLWELGSFAVVLEAKNNSASNDGVSKADVGQLLNSKEWAVDVYGDPWVVVPVVVHPQSQFHEKANPSEDCRLISKDVLQRILDDCEKFVAKLVSLTPIERTELAFKNCLRENRLDSEALMNRFLTRD